MASILPFEKSSLEPPLSGVKRASWDDDLSARIAFHAKARTRRAESGIVRYLADEQHGVDVTLEIDVEALAAPPAAP